MTSTTTETETTTTTTESEPIHPYSDALALVRQAIEALASSECPTVDEHLSQAEAVLVADIIEDDEVREWEYREEGHSEILPGMLTADDAREAAEDLAAGGDYGEVTETIRVRWWVSCELTGEEDSGRVEIDPEEPDCADGHEHDWRTPHSVVGGCKESPGVWGHGGGVTCKGVCARCGAYRITDSWTQDRSTGEQGLDSTSYEPADDASREWVAAITEGDTED
jgi:hypothetical protein